MRWQEQAQQVIASLADDFGELDVQVEAVEEVILAYLDASTYSGYRRGGAFSLSVLRIQDTGDGRSNGVVSGLLVGR